MMPSITGSVVISPNPKPEVVLCQTSGSRPESLDLMYTGVDGNLLFLLRLGFKVSRNSHMDYCTLGSIFRSPYFEKVGSGSNDPRSRKWCFDF